MKKIILLAAVVMMGFSSTRVPAPDVADPAAKSSITKGKTMAKQFFSRYRLYLC